MNTTESLANHFLIAMPALADPNFSHTVTYICEHNEEGAMGIIINRPLHIHLREVLEQMQVEASPKTDLDTPIYLGGPVQSERGFVLHSPVGSWASSLGITEQVAITTSRDIISAIAHSEGPTRYLLALGYAGWGGGQLEREMAENAWLSGPADLDILFDMPEEARWSAAAALLGVEINLISDEIGHA